MSQAALTSTDEEALSLVMNVLQRISDTALKGFSGDSGDDADSLSAIHNLARDTVAALAKRRLS